MARPGRKPANPPPFPSNSLVASAVRFSGKAARIYHAGGDWQTQCYRHYAICGEARFAAKFFGHAMSRATLGIGAPSASGYENVTEGKAYDLLNDLFNGPNGQAQMLESIGIHLTIAGECYLIGREVTDEEGNKADIWEILSVLEVKVVGKKWYIHYADDEPDIELSDDDVVIRIWNPNPAKRIEADSPFRSLLPILTEIEWATRNIFGQTSSRLAGAGLLMLPQGMTFPPPPAVNGEEQTYENEAEGFMLSLADAMMTPISDPSSPSAMVPIIVQAPPEAIDKVELLHFWSDLDANVVEMRSESIRRFAVGMDMPMEQILGMSGSEGTGGGNTNGVSHWGAWQIEEATIKMHIEPMLDLVTNALTVSYLRPQHDTEEVVVHNTAALRLRPDRSRESMELAALGLVKGDVAVRENGFDPLTDMPDENELKVFFLRKIASGSATPEQVAAALQILFGIDLPSEEGVPRESRPDPTLEDHPDRPRTPAESTPAPPTSVPDAAALLAASEGLIYRALEKAGNRVINSGRRGKDRDTTIVPYDAHVAIPVNGEGKSLLTDAFSCAPQVLDGIADPDVIVPRLESYCLDLFRQRVPHSRQRLEAVLEGWPER